MLWAMTIARFSWSKSLTIALLASFALLGGCGDDDDVSSTGGTGGTGATGGTDGGTGATGGSGGTGGSTGGASGSGGATGGTAGSGGSTGGAAGSGGTAGAGGAAGAGGSAGAGGAEADCTKSGGTVTTTLCCQATGDFPNLCTTGPCGCAPANSHNVKTCQCPSGQCFDGSKCK